MPKLDTCYLDVDGVCGDFVGACERLFGFDRWDVLIPGEFYIHKWLGVPSGPMWQTIREAGSAFWSEMEPCPWFGSLLLLLKDNFDRIVVTTHCQDWPECYVGKWEWLRKHYPGAHKPIYVEEKWRLVERGCVLVDDYDKNVADWTERKGHAALFAQPWNQFHNEAMARRFDPVAHLARRLYHYQHGECVTMRDHGVFI